jgi:hypothetical protein
VERQVDDKKIQSDPNYARAYVCAPARSLQRGPDLIAGPFCISGPCRKSGTPAGLLLPFRYNEMSKRFCVFVIKPRNLETRPPAVERENEMETINYADAIVIIAWHVVAYFIVTRAGTEAGRK